jgi:hypothetical protein
MAMTLAEAAKLSNDIVLQGVIETIVLDSPILQALPFIEITGNGLTYNRENTNPAAAFFSVSDTWVEGTPTFSQITATLSIVGGDADIDNFLLTTRSNLQDLQAAIIRLKAKAVQQKFEDTFVNGDRTVDAKSFDGIDKLTAGGQVASMGANGVSDYISDAKTVGTSADCSTVYAMQFGEGALAGLSAPGGLQVETIGSLETKDVTRTRVKWYVSTALFNTIKVAKLTGIRP